ncbi:class I SAM-dependent methyltransferase [Microvirga massiliensis]|uniref:class I SAM-dependent methyltransferase n=1 Tax=Microvirga massiliensis TaxID=1033741 RepID=UPI00062BCD9E|nr:class I SAM-dependent methyltransferase [Microvirga massiliensis]
MEDYQTATRATLSEEWKASRALLDWMHAPNMANYVNKLVSGRELEEGGHWAIYAREKFVRALGDHRRTGLSMVSLACGAAHIEESLLQFGWPVSRVLGLEYDSELRRAAAERFAKIDGVEARFEFYDFNAPHAIAEKFDLVFTCHSIHHAADLEKFLPAINNLLAEDGIIIGIDYFGPARFQVEYDVRPIINELDAILPDELKHDLRFESCHVNPSFHYATIEEVRNADVSESVRSSDLRTLLFANFPIVEIKPMGGTLLRWLLQYRAGNFNPDNPCHMSIARLLQVIERNHIEKGTIRSDDLFFVLRKSARLGNT